MAQTRKRRRTKHRGNAVGIVEARGRTGRKPTAEERKLSSRETAKSKREERMSRPPTWSAAINRAAMSAIAFVALLVLLLDQPISAALGLGAFVMLFYVPLAYYTDRFVYRRRQRQRSGQRS